MNMYSGIQVSYNGQCVEAFMSEMQFNFKIKLKCFHLFNFVLSPQSEAFELYQYANNEYPV